MADRRKKAPWPSILLAGRPDAPALWEWLLRSVEYADGLSVVSRVAAVSRVSEPTLRAGGPVQPARRAQFVERVLASQIRAVERGANKDVDMAGHLRGAAYPTAFAAFAGGYSPSMLELCDAMDRVSEAVATRYWNWSQGAQAVVEIGSRVAAQRSEALPAAPDDCVAVDAMLLVLAHLDIQVLLDHHDPEYPVRSLLLRVSPQLHDGQIRRWPYARLLDQLYAMGRLSSGRELDKHLPLIAQLDAELGTTPEHGAKSKVGHWRTGRPMRRIDFDEIVMRRFPGEMERFAANKLYVGATFWHTLMKEAPDKMMWALDRFQHWWSLFRPHDFVDGPRSCHPFDTVA